MHIGETIRNYEFFIKFVWIIAESYKHAKFLEFMTNHSVAVIGNCYFDEILTIEGHPLPDEKILASDLRIIMGGGATNTSVGLVKLGVDVYLFTVLGNDKAAYRLFKQIRKKGIITSNINHISGKTGRTVILIDKNKSSTKIGYQGVCSDMSETILFDRLANPEINHVHLTSVNIQTIRNALKFKSLQTYSLDFGAKTLKSSKDELIELLNQIDLVFFNKKIFEDLYGYSVKELDSAELSFDFVINAGTDGIYGKINGKSAHQPIIPVNVVDTTGAGDASAATVIYGYKNNFDTKKILEYAVKAASIKIQTSGGSKGHPTVEELDIK